MRANSVTIHFDCVNFRVTLFYAIVANSSVREIQDDLGQNCKQ